MTAEGRRESIESCWNIKAECPFRGTHPAGSRCPAFAARVPCRDFDWPAFHRAMPDCAEKDLWREVMLERCPACEVRERHREEVDAFLSALAEPPPAEDRSRPT